MKAITITPIRAHFNLRAGVNEFADGYRGFAVS